MENGNLNNCLRNGILSNFKSLALRQWSLEYRASAEFAGTRWDDGDFL
jgi:hypothetical protein